MNALSELYRSDFHAWALRAAEMVRQRRFDELNIEELAEELDSMGRKERTEAANRLVILLAHLLKWQFQPAYRSTSWRGSIIEQRKQLLRLLRQSPSVKPYLPEAVLDAYPDALDLAARETLPCWTRRCSRRAARTRRNRFWIMISIPELRSEGRCLTAA